MRKNNRLYYRCSECKELCDTEELDFGIGSYEFWGAPGCDSNIQEVSTCCNGDPWTPEQYEEWVAENEEEPA